MSAETRSRVGRHEPTSMSADTQPILYHHSAATRPPLSQYFTNTRTTLSSLGQLLLPSSIFPALLREAFSGHRSFLAFNSGNIHVFFPVMFFFSSSLLYTTLFTFGCSSIWGLLLLEARYFRGAKDDIKSWYDCALFLPHG